MKTKYSLMLFILLFPVFVYAQQGNTMSSPLEVGAFGSDFEYSDTKNTENFTNNYGSFHNDIFYKFILTTRMRVIISHCGSLILDTSINLLNASGKWVTSASGYDGSYVCGESGQSYLSVVLEPGTYYAVSEVAQYSTEEGNITTRISGMSLSAVGNTMSNPILVGTHSNSIYYSDTQDTNRFTDQYNEEEDFRGQDEVFYQFTISKKMYVILSHCSSVVSCTYMYLLDSSGNLIEYSSGNNGKGECGSSLDLALIEKNLEAGTYYVVSEGYEESGPITTNIIAYAPGDFNYPVVPGVYNEEDVAVGGFGGTFNVSATGGATYSIPIKVPQGAGGLQPSLAIVYNSQAGNGIAGWGCNISGISAITRGPKDIYHDGMAKALTYSADDAYYLDGKRLIYSTGTVGQEGAVYYPESDPFTKVTVHGTYNNTTANTWFEVQTSDGLVYYYGNTAEARQSYTVGSSPRIYAWYVDRVEDTWGNYMTYTYNVWDYTIYPKSISYGKNKNGITGHYNTITFDYESRPDPQPFIIEGVKGKMGYRLKTITGKASTSIYLIYELTYSATSDGSGTQFSRLANVRKKNSSGEALKPVYLQWLPLPSFQQSVISPQFNMPSVFPVVNMSGNAMSFGDQQFTSGDFNGDGLADLVGVFRGKIQTGPGAWSYNTYAYVYWASRDADGNINFLPGRQYTLGSEFQMEDWKEYKAGSSVIDFDGDGLNEFVIPHASINDYWKQIGFAIYGNTVQGIFGYNLQRSSEMPVYATGDFNNDGKGEIVFLEKGHTSNKYPGEIIGHNSGTTIYRTTINLTLSSKPKKVFVSDLNGNGLQDMLLIYNGGYTIFWNQGGGLTGTIFSDAKKTTGTNIGNVWMIRSGDFNGDGLMDLLMNATGDSKWYFALNNGDGTFTKSQACILDIYDEDFTEKDDNKFDCYVYDFDFDGKSDVVITKAMHKKKSDILGSWGEFKKTYTYWMRSTGRLLSQVASATSNKSEDALTALHALGDFNGDGQVELMNYGYNCYNSTDANVNPTWNIYQNSSYNAGTGKVASIIGDYGSKTIINYASLVNGGIYTKGSGSAYPMLDCIMPLHVVKTTTLNNNGVAANMITNYQYGGLKVHQQGKGLLGISFMKVENALLGTVNESGVSSWNTSFYIPSSTYSKTTIDSKTAESNTTMVIVDKGSKKYFAYPSVATEKDLDGNIVTTTRQFSSSYGYMTEEKADFGDNMCKTVQYGNYILAGKSYRPRLITRTQRHTDDTSTFTQKTSIVYDEAIGYKKKVIENYGSSLPLTTEYTYDTWGNVLSSTNSGTGITALTQYYTYDFSKRFVAGTHTSPSSAIKDYTYDIWGNVLTETDLSDSSNRLITKHFYDGWGNREKTILPDGRRMEYETGWKRGRPTQRFFTLTQGTGQPWVITWYDNQEREVLMETIGAKDVRIKKTMTYDVKGQVIREQVQTGNLVTTEDYTYDGRGRILTQTSSTGQSVSYTYGNRSVSTTTNGRTYTKTYDAWGNVKSVTDPVSSITYTYASLGKPKKITTGGADFTMTYYDTGNQKTLVDPNAGSITYTYDAAGRLKTQVDSKNKTTTNTYDPLGRLKTSVLDEVTTTYSYGTSGNDLLRLIKEQTGDSHIAYTYDKYGRISTEKRQVDNSGLLEFTYDYNAVGQLSRITYPGALAVNRSYDAYGNLQQVLAGTQSIWELTGVTGTVTTTKLGGTLISTETRNSQGLLSNLKTMKGTTSLHNMNYVFNGATGNLTSRTGMIGQTETFTYDSADRLTVVKQASFTVMNMGYHANGNIASKTGLGSYSYDKPHAVSAVDNTGGLISENNQAIAYTAFDKVSSISEVVGSNNYLLNITYGPDRQRWKSTLKTNNAVTRTIVYAGDYEMVTEGGVTKQLYYLGGNNGLAAVYVKQSGQSDKIYYAHKDHLGSIVKLTDNAGTEVFKASYDVWGRRTVANNTFKFHRGYTGHEHLDEFKLIDMNGRMYDPLLARFLSPDPFVQMPDFSQNFNRYTYCLNNPLIYTDPSGEWNWLVGGLGFVFGYVSHGLTSGNWGWEALGNGVLTGAMWGVGYTSGVKEAGTSPLLYSAYSAGSSTINSFMPSMNVPIGNNFGLSVSPGIGFGTTGFTAGINAGIGYSDGDFSIGAGVGVGDNHWGWNASATYNGVGVGYGLTYYGKTQGPDGKSNAQRVANITAYWKGGSFALQNDMISLGGDGDRWRTNAFELSVGDFSFGSYIYTNDGKTDSEKQQDENARSPIWGKNRNKGYSTWKNGQVFSAPVWIGYRRGNQIMRIGYSHKVFQDLQQNGIHGRTGFGNQNFYLNYDNFKTGGYFYSGYYNPLSLWGK